jgi:hypothetical protein
MSMVGPPNKNPYLLSSVIMINIIANKILKSNICYKSNRAVHCTEGSRGNPPPPLPHQPRKFN